MTGSTGLGSDHEPSRGVVEDEPWRLCEREPIHQPGLIQPHGALVAFDAFGRLLQVSANLGRWLPLAGLLPSSTLADLLGEAAGERVEKALARLDDGAPHALIPLPARPSQAQALNLLARLHRQAGVGIAEFEPCMGHVDAESCPPEAEVREINQGIRETLEILRAARSLDELQQLAATCVRRLVACDRVMVYRFHPDWHGEVTAEARHEDLEPYLGLHYPAGDIPAQARALYVLNLVRYLADRDAVNVPLQPCVDDAWMKPLDMSHAVLRSVAPVHLEYLRNMGVRSTLTLSILVDGQLWGMVACHHREPLALHPCLREACHELSVQLGLLVGWAVQRQQALDVNVALQSQGRIVDAFSRMHLAIDDAVERCHVDLLSLTGSSGAAFWQDGRIWPVGLWPSSAAGAAILRRVLDDFEATRDDLLSTDALDLDAATLRPHERRQCCGLLALRIDAAGRSGLIWLRPEQRREVAWGGDPEHATEVTRDAGGRPVLHPRSSFGRWEQLVEGRSRAWTPADLVAARGLQALQPVLGLREALAETRRSDSQFRSLVAVQADAYWQVDNDGTLLALSRHLRMLPGPVFGRRWLDLLGPLLDGTSLALLTQTLAGQEPFRDLCVQGVDPATRLAFEIHVNGTPMRGADGRKVGWHGTLTDTTANMNLQRELASRDALQRAMLDNDLVASIRVLDGHISWANRAMVRLFGCPEDVFVGRPLASLFSDAVESRGALEQALEQLAAGQSFRGQLRMRRLDGQDVWIDLSGMVLSQSPSETMWLMNDLSAMRALQDEALHQARHDSLTRLPNRAYMLEKIEQSLAAADRHGGSVVLCYLDLDGFKPVNDLHGHAAGDEVLREVAQRLQALVRRDESVGRFGGDEFVVLLPQGARREDLEALMQRLLDAVGQPVALESGRSVHVTASVGVAVSPVDGSDARALLSSADEALYVGKAVGGGRLFFASDLATGREA